MSDTKAQLLSVYINTSVDQGIAAEGLEPTVENRILVLRKMYKKIAADNAFGPDARLVLRAITDEIITHQELQHKQRQARLDEALRSMDSQLAG